jgi:hypothetical protein
VEAPQRLVVVVHLATAWSMVGLIWMVQLVHYPLFDRVDPSRWSGFHADHSARITWVLALPMPLQLLTALVLVAAPPAGAHRALLAVALGGVAVALAVTALVSVPAHDVLSTGYDADAHRRLVVSNWTRTAAWTVAAGAATAALWPRIGA